MKRSSTRFIWVIGFAILLGACVSHSEGPRLTGLDVRATTGGIGTLTPAFSANAFDYAVDVQSDIGEVFVIPSVDGSSSMVTSVNEKPVPAGGVKVALSAEGGAARVVVKDGSGRSTAYAVSIKREDITPVLAQFRKLTYSDPTTGVSMGYRLFVPAGYDSSKSYPLILFLHGAGESGADNEIQLTANQGATVWAKPAEQARHPCFVLAPQNPKDPRATSPNDFGRRGWTSLMQSGFSDPFRSQPPLQTVYDILRKVAADYNVDTKRIYATGLSMGGFGVFALNVDHPDTFAAIVGICGGLDPSRADVLAKKPIWVFHAAEDPMVYVKFSRDTVKALKDAGGAPRYTEYGRETYFSVNAHWAWVPAYASSEMRDWLFAQSR